jgi:hypothetical protein
VTDAWDGEAVGEKTAVSLDDREDEDEEAPEREGVRETWDRPAQQALLADDFSHLDADATSDMTPVGRGRRTRTY